MHRRALEGRTLLGTLFKLRDLLLLLRCRRTVEARLSLPPSLLGAAQRHLPAGAHGPSRQPAGAHLRSSSSCRALRSRPKVLRSRASSKTQGSRKKLKTLSFRHFPLQTYYQNKLRQTPAQLSLPMPSMRRRPLRSRQSPARALSRSLLLIIYIIIIVDILSAHGLFYSIQRAHTHEAQKSSVGRERVFLRDLAVRP